MIFNYHFSHQESVQEDLDSLYRGLASTLGEKEDHIMVEDLAGEIYFSSVYDYY